MLKCKAASRPNRPPQRGRASRPAPTWRRIFGASARFSSPSGCGVRRSDTTIRKRLLKYLGIDYGEERIGLAAGESNSGLAFALPTLQRKKYPGREAFFVAILKIIEQESIEAIVVGLPLPLTPLTTPVNSPLNLTQPELEPLSCRRARNFAASLKRRCALPIFLVNEALSSAEAEERLKEAGLKGKKLLNALDSQAAVIILETFFNLPVEQHNAI